MLPASPARGQELYWERYDRKPGRAPAGWQPSEAVGAAERSGTVLPAKCPRKCTHLYTAPAKRSEPRCFRPPLVAAREHSQGAVYSVRHLTASESCSNLVALSRVMTSLEGETVFEKTGTRPPIGHCETCAVKRFIVNLAKPVPEGTRLDLLLRPLRRGIRRAED